MNCIEKERERERRGDNIERVYEPDNNIKHFKTNFESNISMLFLSSVCISSNIQFTISL